MERRWPTLVIAAICGLFLFAWAYFMAGVVTSKADDTGKPIPLIAAKPLVVALVEIIIGLSVMLYGVLVAWRKLRPRWWAPLVLTFVIAAAYPFFLILLIGLLPGPFVEVGHSPEKMGHLMGCILWPALILTIALILAFSPRKPQP